MHGRPLKFNQVYITGLAVRYENSYRTIYHQQYPRRGYCRHTYSQYRWHVQRSNQNIAYQQRRRAMKRLIYPIIIIISISAVTITIFACAWTQTDKSVRFNGYRNMRDFGLLPP